MTDDNTQKPNLRGKKPRTIDKINSDSATISSKSVHATSSSLLHEEPSDLDDLIEAVARGWCSPENSHKIMDEALAMAIVDEVFPLIVKWRTRCNENSDIIDKVILQRDHPTCFSAMDVIDITQGDLLGYLKTAVRATDTTLDVDWLPERRSVSDMLLVEHLPGQVVVEAVGLLSGGDHPVVMRALHQTAATTFKVGSEVRAMKSVAWKVERRA